MELSFENLYLVIKKDWDQLKFNSNIPRFKNAIEYTENIKSDFISNIQSIHDLHHTGKLKLEDAITFTLDFTLELSSFLFAAGYETKIWKRWLSIYTANLLLAKNYPDVLIYSLIAEERNVFESLPDLPSRSKQISEQVLWILTRKTINHAISSKNLNGIDKSLYSLLKSIPVKDYKMIEKSFKNIVAYFIEEGAIDTFVFGQYPVFEPVLCAIASIARSNGYKPFNLSKEEYLFFEPGLSMSDRQPLITCKKKISTCYLTE